MTARVTEGVSKSEEKERLLAVYRLGLWREGEVGPVSILFNTSFQYSIVALGISYDSSILKAYVKTGRKRGSGRTEVFKKVLTDKLSPSCCSLSPATN